MRLVYDPLKVSLGLPQDAALDIFDAFCARTGNLADAMEWSCKAEGDLVLTNRLFWLGSGGRREETTDAIEWLGAQLSTLEFPANWRTVLRDHTERALVAWAGPNPQKNLPAAIKIYLTLDDCDERLYAESFRSLCPGLPATPPPGNVTPLLCCAAYETGQAAGRAYFLYTASEFQNPAVCEYFEALAGKRAVEIAAAHPSAGFAFKNDTTDMLGLSLRPTGLPLDDHDSWWNSPALTPLLTLAGQLPELRQRLDRVSWLTVPLTDEALSFPFRMPEMNVYVRV